MNAAPGVVAALLALVSTPVVARAAQCQFEAKVQPDNVKAVAGTFVGGVWTPSVIQLNGSPSKGDTFSWVQAVGETPHVALSGADSKQATFVAPDVGPDGLTLNFSFTVSGCGLTATIPVTVSISYVAHNAGPTAVAAITPSTVDEGDTFTLDGSGSTDPDGDALTYRWELKRDDGTYETVATTATQPLTAPAVPWPDGKTFTYRLTVSDGHLTDFEEKTLTVAWVDDPPVAKASCTSPVKEREPIEFDMSGSTDADDGIASYAWKLGTSGPTLTLPDPADYQAYTSFSVDAPSITAATGDTMKFELEVTDFAGNYATDTCTVKVLDATPPELTLPADITAAPTEAGGAFVTYTASANDNMDGTSTPSCTPASGSLFLGTTTVKCTAVDKSGNEAEGTFLVTVKYAVSGFFQPVDSSETLTNTVKNGATVPLKWRLFGADSVEFTTLETVESVQSVPVACTTLSAVEDVLPSDLTATGGTSVRYDTTGHQFIFNWQTPKAPGSCFRAIVTFADGSAATANFKLK